MQLFYLENPKNQIILSTEESRHTTKVLRKKEGDILNFTDGKGKLYKAEITVSDKKKCQLNIISSQIQKKQHNYHLHIGIAPTKNIDRFEWFLEKATEIGIDEITPIICSRSERKIIKLERCKRILRSAIKQSLKYYLPKINDTITFNQLLKKNLVANKYIAHCGNLKKKDLKKTDRKERTLILIGPEGDFSKEEIEMALKNNFKPVSLGNSRLRTETAGIIATHTINIIK